MSRACKWRTRVANARVALMDVIIVIVGSTGNVLSSYALNVCISLNVL